MSKKRNVSRKVRVSSKLLCNACGRVRIDSDKVARTFISPTTIMIIILLLYYCVTCYCAVTVANAYARDVLRVEKR